MNVNPSLLNAAFSRKSFRSLLEDGEHSKSSLDEALSAFCSEDSSYGDAIAMLYRAAFRSHRNEYIYKNTIFNKIVLGRHNVNTCCAFEEMPIGSSIADMVVINGKATVYEIKSDLDNLNKLDHQLEDYYSAFDTVYVVCGERMGVRLSSRLRESPVGIIVLTDRSTLSVRKKAWSYMGRITASVLFDLLRKAERENLLIGLDDNLPECVPANYYSECKALFCSHSVEELYPRVLTALKQRKRGVESAAISALPPELKLLGYMSDVTSNQASMLLERLSSERVEGRGCICLQG